MNPHPNKPNPLGICPNCKTISIHPEEAICSTCGKKRASSPRKKILWLMYSFLTILFLFTSFQCWWIKDSSPPNTSDLQVTPRKISGDNGYLTLQKALGKISYKPKEENLAQDMAKGKAWDETVASNLLQQNTEALKLYETAVQAPGWAYPLPKKVSVKDPLPNIMQCRFLAHLQAIRARKLQKEGKEKEAWEAAFSIVQYGSSLENCQGYLILCLVGSAIKEMGFSLIQEFSAKTNLSSPDLIAYAKKISALEDHFKEGLKDAIKLEYMVASNLIDDLLTGKTDFSAVEKPKKISQQATKALLNIPYFFMPNDTRRQIAWFQRNYLKMVSGSYAESQNTRLRMQKRIDFISQRGKSGPQKLLGRLATPNAIGRTLLAMAMPNYSRIANIEWMELGHSRLLEVSLLVRAFQKDKGKLPSSLAELYPQYLKVVPPDPFSEKKEVLQYSPSTRELYSVGRDLKELDGDRKKNLTLKLE